MEATDLRIGNLVNLCFNHKEGWFPAKVTAIHKDLTIDTDTKESKKNKYFWAGVPLTSDVLDKLGIKAGEWFIEDSYKITVSIGVEGWDITTRNANHTTELIIM